MQSRKTVSAALAAFAAFALIAVVACERDAGTAREAPGAPPAIRYEAHVSAGGVPPPAGELRNPYKGDNKQRAETGAALFSQMNCDGCHGGGAPGWVGPSLADGSWRYGGAEDEIFHSIFYGRPKGMPAYGGVVGSDGIWMLVTYIQSLPAAAMARTQSWEAVAPEPAVAPQPTRESPPAQREDRAQSVEAMLQRYGCVACHAVDKKVIGPAFKDVQAVVQRILGSK